MSASADKLQIFKAETFFASEIKEARRKGFELQVGVGRKGVRARLVPVAPFAIAACHARGAGSFESRCEIPPGGDGMDGVREVIRAAFEEMERVLG